MCPYPFIVSLYWLDESYNTLDGLSSRICVPDKTIDVNLNVFNMATGTNKSKALIKHILCNCKGEFDSRKCT